MIPSDLGPSDFGLLLILTDYPYHLLRWDGVAWAFAPGDPGSGFIHDFLVTPSDAGWVTCDGSSTDYLTLPPAATSITLPNDPGTAPYTRMFRR